MMRLQHGIRLEILCSGNEQPEGYLKTCTIISRLSGILLIATVLAACSSEQLRRTSYETLKATERQRCLNEAFSDCPRQAEYDEYQQQRERELNPPGNE